MGAPGTRTGVRACCDQSWGLPLACRRMCSPAHAAVCELQALCAAELCAGQPCSQHSTACLDDGLMDCHTHASDCCRTLRRTRSVSSGNALPAQQQHHILSLEPALQTASPQQQQQRHNNSKHHVQLWHLQEGAWRVDAFPDTHHAALRVLCIVECHLARAKARC